MVQITMTNSKLTVLEKNIFYYEKAISNYDTLIERIEKLDKLTDPEKENEHLITKWKTWGPDENNTFGMQKRVVDSLRADSDSPLYLDLVQIVLDIETAIKACSYDYAKKNNLEIGSLSPLSISKYDKGANMGKHVDSYDENGSETISVVGYINDDYEGGEIEFPEQNIIVKPTAGSIIIFPSQKPYFHSSNIIKNGNKYISPGFWKK